MNYNQNFPSSAQRVRCSPPHCATTSGDPNGHDANPLPVLQPLATPMCVILNQPKHPRPMPDTPYLAETSSDHSECDTSLLLLPHATTPVLKLRAKIFVRFFLFAIQNSILTKKRFLPPQT